MSTPRLARVADGFSCMVTLFVAFWIYEIANWFSLALAGANPTLTWSGILPVGVIAVAPHSGGFLDAKLFQVGICVGTMLSLWTLANRFRLKLTRVTIAGLTGIFIASLYWEMLSVAAFVPMYVHEVAYAALSYAVTLGLLKVLPGISYRVRYLRMF